jgi:hypothetical protein
LPLALPLALLLLWLWLMSKCAQESVECRVSSVDSR